MKEVKNKKGETRLLYHDVRFIDSFKFMATSLEKLVNNLPKDDFINVKRYYKDDKLELVTRKGVYPYEYMDTPEKLKETQLERRFILGLMTRVLLTRITRTLEKFGKPLR